MLARLNRFKFVIVLFAMLVLTGGCSAKFTYNNLGWLSSFWIDDYVSLNNQQEKTAKTLIKQARDWHRQTQLPVYKADLLALNELLKSNADAAQIKANLMQAKKHWQALIHYIEPGLLNLAVSLSAEQRTEFVAAIEQQLDEEQENFNEQSEQQRKDKRLEEQIDNYEQWLGRNLSRQQKALITNYNAQRIDTFNLWHAYKRARLAALKVVFFDTQFTEQVFRAKLSQVILDRSFYMSDELIAADERNLLLYAELLVSLKGTVTEKQLGRYDEEFADLISQINELIDD